MQKNIKFMLKSQLKIRESKLKYLTAKIVLIH